MAGRSFAPKKPVENFASSVVQSPCTNDTKLGAKDICTSASTGAALVQSDLVQDVTPLESTLHHVAPNSTGASNNLVQAADKFGAKRATPNLVQTSFTPKNYLPYEWRCSWKTSSKGVRAIWKRMRVQEHGRWRWATRKDKEAGLVPDVTINEEVKSFSPQAADRIERLGDDRIKRTIEHHLNTRNDHSARHVA